MCEAEPWWLDGLNEANGATWAGPPTSSGSDKGWVNLVCHWSSHCCHQQKIFLNQKIILVKWSDCYIARRWMKTFKKELTKRRKNCDCVPNLFAMSFISIMNDFLWRTRRNIINNLTFLAENFAHIFNASMISEFKYGPIFNNALEVQKL